MSGAAITHRQDAGTYTDVARNLRLFAALTPPGGTIETTLELSADQARDLARVIDRGLAAGRDAGAAREGLAHAVLAARMLAEAEAQLTQMLRAACALVVLHAALPVILRGIGAW